MLRRYLLLLAIAIHLTACTTFEVGIVRTPTPDLPAVGTLAALMVEATHMSALATERAIPYTPTPSPSWVSGKVCYPAQNIPPMLAFFRNLDSDQVVQLALQAGQVSYSLSLPTGDYYAYAWAPEYQVGGMYSMAVNCDEDEDCSNHEPKPFRVGAGEMITGIDLCDWVIPLERLPLAPSQILPGMENHLPGDENP